MTLDWQSWGYRRDAQLVEYMSIYDLLKTLVQTVSCGGKGRAAQASFSITSLKSSPRILGRVREKLQK